MTCLSEATPHPFVMPAPKPKPPIASVVGHSGRSTPRCLLLVGRMAGVAQQRERDLTALSAEVKAAYEQYDSAAEEAAAAKAAWKAAEGIVGAREVAELKGCYYAFKEKEERRKERYEDLKEKEKLRLQAELPGAGERSPLWACPMVSVCEAPTSAHFQSQAYCCMMSAAPGAIWVSQTGVWLELSIMCPGVCSWCTCIS